MGDLLNSRITSDTFPNLELEDNLLHPSTDEHFPPSLSSQPLPVSAPSPSAGSTGALNDRTFSLSSLSKPEPSLPSSPPSSHYSSDHVPSPYSDHISSPHSSSYQNEPALLLEVPLNGLPGAPRSSWSNLALSLTDPVQFGNLLTSDAHLLSTSLSTPPSITRSPAAPSSTSSPTNSTRDLLGSSQPKLQLPQFSAAFGHQLASHSGIPKDVQPSHSSMAPPTGFIATSATTASANNSAQQSN